MSSLLEFRPSGERLVKMRAGVGNLLCGCAMRIFSCQAHVFFCLYVCVILLCCQFHMQPAPLSVIAHAMDLAVGRLIVPMCTDVFFCLPATCIVMHLACVSFWWLHSFCQFFWLFVDVSSSPFIWGTRIVILHFWAEGCRCLPLMFEFLLDVCWFGVCGTPNGHNERSCQPEIAIICDEPHTRAQTHRYAHMHQQRHALRGNEIIPPSHTHPHAHTHKELCCISPHN